MEKIIETIANELGVKNTQVENAVKLIDEGNTIPFIARYRKEVTGGLSDETLRELGERLTYLRNLEQRKQEVVKSIEEQGKLTDEILQGLAIAKTLAEVEDIYRPIQTKKENKSNSSKSKRTRTTSTNNNRPKRNNRHKRNSKTIHKHRKIIRRRQEK